MYDAGSDGVERIGPVELHTADVLEWVQHYDGARCHALLCDPPYHLTTERRFGPGTSAPSNPAFARAAAGFMGKTWDGGDLAFRSETWAALASVLLPGAFVLAFAGSRGWHRQAVAMEDAGLVMHPTIFGWAYGSGFRKATKIADPRFAGTHYYGRQALKPALEPILCAQVPGTEPQRDGIVKTGAGALNVGGCRVGTGGQRLWTEPRGMGYREADDPGVGVSYRSSDGRWPANFHLVHHPDCNGQCHPDCPVRRLGEQSGMLNSGTVKAGTTRQQGVGYSDGPSYTVEADTYGDSGTAARYFHNFGWSLDVAEQFADADAVTYCGKASAAERNAGLDGEAVTVDDGRQTPIDNPYLRGETARRNPHPTVKPLELIETYARLLLPPADYAPRRIFVPFAGSGSECIGAMRAGWEAVIGVEREAEYAAVAAQRLQHWLERQPHPTLPLEEAADA